MVNQTELGNTQYIDGIEVTELQKILIMFYLSLTPQVRHLILAMYYYSAAKMDQNIER